MTGIRFACVVLIAFASTSLVAASEAPDAESLWRLAIEGKLSDDLAELAGKMLDDEDPFVRALAEWAIATRVQMDNGGQVAVWPSADPPAWFVRWSQQTPEELLDADYARLAITWGIHRNGSDLLPSVSKILDRARGAASEIPPSASEATHAMVARQLKRLESIQRELAELIRTSPDEITAARRLWLAARHTARPIVMANPAVDFDRLVFVRRHSAHSHRNITGSQYPWVHKPGGDICVKTGLRPGGAVRDVLDGRLGPGHVHGADLHRDADRVVFGYAVQEHWPPEYNTVLGDEVFRLRGTQQPTHLYEIRLDGSGLRQLTDDPYWSDLEPTYCADGGVVFASDRSGRSSECGKFSADHTVINLYTVDSDGSNLRRLTDNKDIDRYPHALDNGLIAYTRWDYQERHFLEVHAIWTVRPDGAMSDAVFNQHITAPYGLRNTRSIPGGNQLVSVATGHHTFAYGAVVMVDPRGGPNDPECIRTVTPHTLPQEGPAPGRAVAEGGVPDKGGLYQTPVALSDRCFLVSYSPALPQSDTQGKNNAAGFAVYLIDVHGNKELVHRDLIHSCSAATPLRKRPPAPVVAELAREDESAVAPGDTAVCYISDVYQGMEGIPRGSVKSIRISQRVGWPLDSEVGAMRYIPGNAWEKQFGHWAWAPVRVIGVAPVEEDGSACFRVPADTAVYFQALDELGMEIRRMRSHVTLQPGEVRGCLGCHETGAKTPGADWSGRLATRQSPDTPQPPPWGAERLLGYEAMIQPILDRRCVGCHNTEDPQGQVDLGSIRAEDGFVQSFRTLFGRRADGTEGPVFVSVSNRFGNAAVSQPLAFGARKSRLVDLLLNDPLHRDEAPLDEDEWQTVVTWIDANAPYFDTFFQGWKAGDGEPVRE